MKNIVAHLAALFTVIIWGVTFISTKILLVAIPAEEILFYRFLLGWLALWLFAPRFLPFQGWRSELVFAGAGFFGVTLYFLLENIALEYTYASNVGVIVSSTPFFTAIAGWLVFRGPKPGDRFYLGFLIAIAGIALISFNDAAIHFSPTGDLLALLAAIAWAFYSGLTRKLTMLNLGSLRTTRRIFFYGLLLMLPVLAFRGLSAGYATLAAPVNAFNLILLGLFASAICFATWTFCLARLGEARASAYIYLVPVITILAAAIWLNEIITLRIIFGAFLTLGGVALSQHKVNPRR